MADSADPADDVLQSCRLVDFEVADLQQLMTEPPTYFMLVSGTKPCLNMRVDLVPRTYIDVPEYWGIEVVGCVPSGLCLPALAPYTASLTNPPMGTKGIEIIGAQHRKKINFPPLLFPQGAFALSIASKYSGELLAATTLTCNPDGGDHPRASEASLQLKAADGRIEAIPADPGDCTLELNPVVLRAIGIWEGEHRYFRAEYPNQCQAVKATGGVVFDF